MKANAPFMLNEDMHAYLKEVFFKEDNDLSDLKTQTDKMPERKMQITPEQGYFLSFLIKSYKVKDILEIGVYTGTSTLYMAKALDEDGKITALDANHEWTKIAQKYWSKAKVDKKINLIIGDAVKTMATLHEQSFDLIFIDADKKNYPTYYEESLRLVRKNGIIIVDNLFMNGKVLSDPNDATVIMMKTLHQKMANDPRTFFTFLPFYDGMALIQKKER